MPVQNSPGLRPPVHGGLDHDPAAVGRGGHATDASGTAETVEQARPVIRMHVHTGLHKS
ncbi:hypothetical protein STBA_58880 [Streptomyces sp. MP131-18]|nr:hypothetical protein STBA_58880 [Streptomyces sp. MP131-18]